MNVEVLKQYTKELSKKITFNTENLYQHNLTLRLNDAYRKVAVNIITTDSINYTNAVNRFTEYLKKFHSTTDSNATGNIQNCLLCDGYYRDNNNYYYEPKFIYYSTTANTLRVLGLRSNAGVNPNDFVILSEFGSSYTIITDTVTTIAMNNVLRPSIQEYTTNLNYNGSKIADIKWTLLKTPMPNNKFLYKWIAVGSGNVSVAWELWSSSVTWSYVTKMVSAAFPSGYGSKIQDNIVYDLDITNVSCSCCKNTTSSNVNCYFERPNTYETATRTIKFKAQAEYIDN